MINHYFLTEEPTLPTINKKKDKKSHALLRDVRAHLGKKQFEKEGLPFELFLSENKDIYLLSLLDTLKKAQECQESVEQEKLLQMLTVLCVRPSFLFGSTPKMQSTSKNNLDDEDQQRAAWKKYRKEIIKMYDMIAKYQAQAQMLEAYWERAKDATRHAATSSLKAPVDEEKMGKLKEAIDLLCTEYCKEIVGIVGANPLLEDIKNVKVDDELIYHCFQKAKFYPFAPVLIIRDIQTKLIKHKRDKSAHLLDGAKNDFWIKTNVSLTKQRDISRITLSYCQNIRETWASYTAGEGQVLQSFLRKNTTDSNQTEQSVAEYCFKYLADSTVDKNLEACSFSVLTADIDLLAYKLAMNHDLDYTKTMQLRDLMVKFAWGSSSVKTLLENNALPLCLANPLEYVRKLLKPDTWFFSQGEKQVEELIKDCSTHILGETNKTDETIKSWEKVSVFFSLTDIMPLALFRSQAVKFDTGMEKQLPEYVRAYYKKLRKRLKNYEDSAMVKELFGRDAANKKLSPELRELIDRNMTWDQAQKFLHECVIPTAEIAALADNERYERQVKKLIEVWKEESIIKKRLKQKFGMHTVIFQSTLTTSFRLLGNEVIKTMLDLSYCLAEPSGRSPSKEPGGNTPE